MSRSLSSWCALNERAELINRDRPLNPQHPPHLMPTKQAGRCAGVWLGTSRLTQVPERRKWFSRIVPLLNLINILLSFACGFQRFSKTPIARLPWLFFPNPKGGWLSCPPPCEKSFHLTPWTLA